MESIQNWPLHKIMALPDCVFGRRWWISGKIYSADEVFYEVAEEQLPERCVIWAMMLNMTQTSATHVHVGVRLVHEQTNVALHWNQSERLFLEWIRPHYAYDLFLPMPCNFFIHDLRYAIVNRPRHVAVRIYSVGGQDAVQGNFALLISGFPTEVPEWLISGQAKSL